MTLKDRIRALHEIQKISIVTRAGDEPAIDIDDCHEVYGDNVIKLFPQCSDPCHHPKNPSGQHIYGGRNDRACLYCGSKSGLDR